MRQNPLAKKSLTCALLRSFGRGIKFIFRQFTFVITFPQVFRFRSSRINANDGKDLCL